MKSTQKLFIENLEVEASIGVYDNEKKFKQKIIFDIEIELINCNPPIKDKLNEVTDYGQFRKIILDVTQRKHYNLLEKLVHDIMEEFLNVKTIAKVRIKITKPEVFKDCKVSFELAKN